MRAVVLHPGEDGYWVVECLSLPGYISQGKSKADAIANIREVIVGWIETAKGNGLRSAADIRRRWPDETSANGN